MVVLLPAVVGIRARALVHYHVHGPGLYGHCAQLLLLACGDGASYITGETLRIDGGFALPGVPEGWAQAYPVEMGFVKNSYRIMTEREEKEHV